MRAYLYVRQSLSMSHKSDNFITLSLSLFPSRTLLQVALSCKSCIPDESTKCVFVSLSASLSVCLSLWLRLSLSLNAVYVFYMSVTCPRTCFSLVIRLSLPLSLSLSGNISRFRVAHKTGRDKNLQPPHPKKKITTKILT